MFVINPYKSVDQIKFGMSASELISAIGSPLNMSKNHRGETSYRYNEFSVVLSSDNQTVVEVSMLPGIDPFVDDVSVFGVPTLFSV